MRFTRFCLEAAFQLHPIGRLNLSEYTKNFLVKIWTLSRCEEYCICIPVEGKDVVLFTGMASVTVTVTTRNVSPISSFLCTCAFVICKHNFSLFFIKICGDRKFRIFHVLNPGRVVLTLSSLMCKGLESLLVRKANDQGHSKMQGFEFCSVGPIICAQE
jgi:hypothetical protein